MREVLQVIMAPGKTFPLHLNIMPILLRQFNHLLKEGKGGRTSNSSRRFASTLVEETIPEDSQVILLTCKQG